MKMNTNVKVNSLGTNEEIKFNFDEELLKQNGFNFIEEQNYPDTWPIPPHWCYNKFFSYKSLEVTFSVNYYIKPYKGSQFCIDVIDDDFGQPYDYQYYLSKNPNNNFALKVQEKVNNLMQIFLNEGLIYEYKIGDYI